jgi:hypothetical protein
VLTRPAAAVVVALLSLGLISESVASEPNVTVAPSTVKQGEPFIITVSNCESGSNGNVGDYTADIQYEMVSPSGYVSATEHVAPDESDGITPIGFYSDVGTVGTWKYDFRCVHHWTPPPQPGEGTFWSETVQVEITPRAQLTAAEKLRCKKKSSSAARRRCRHREAAD